MKLKIIYLCSVISLLCGNSAFGMDYDENELYEDPWKDMKSHSEDMQKPMTHRLERQKRQLRQLNAEFKANQKESEKLREKFRKSDSNLDNSSQKVKKIVEQIEQLSKIEEKPSYSKFKQNKRPSLGIRVNHKPANLVLGKKDQQFFDKTVKIRQNNVNITQNNSDDMDWEPTTSNLEQQKIQLLNQKLEEANKVINELKQQLETAKLQIHAQEQQNQTNERLSNSQKSDNPNSITPNGFSSVIPKPISSKPLSNPNYTTPSEFSFGNSNSQKPNNSNFATSQSQLLESIRKGKISQQEYERLIRDGTFFSILSLHINSYPSRVQSAIADKVEEKQTSSSDGIFHSKLPAEIIRDNSSLFRDPEFVRRLKPAFAEHFFNSDKESNERIIPFLIVKNLNSTTSVSFATPKPNNPNSTKPSNFNFKTLKTEDKPASSGFSFATSKPNNPNSAGNTDFSFGKTTTAIPADLYNSNKIQYYNGWGFNPKNPHLGAAKEDTTSAQAQLFEAIEKGNLSDVSNAIKNGANINEQDKNGNTPLNKASQNGHLEIVKFLIKYGADVNKSGNDGWTPLHGASHNGHLEIVKFLVKNGADINRKTTISERTPSYIAKFQQHQEIADYLESKDTKSELADYSSADNLSNADSDNRNKKTNKKNKKQPSTILNQPRAME